MAHEALAAAGCPDRLREPRLRSQQWAAQHQRADPQDRSCQAAGEVLTEATGNADLLVVGPLADMETLAGAFKDILIFIRRVLKRSKKGMFDDDPSVINLFQVGPSPSRWIKLISEGERTGSGKMR